MPFECDLTARKRKKWMLEEPEQKRQRVENAMEFINRQLEAVKATGSMLEDWKEDWCKGKSFTMLYIELGRLLEFLRAYRREITTTMERIEEENMRSELKQLYEDLQTKVLTTYEPYWESLADELQCLTSIFETKVNADDLYDENMERCSMSSKKLRYLDYQYNSKGNDKDAKLNESRELQVIHDVAKDFLDSYACLRSFLSTCPMLWEQIFALTYLVQTNLKEVVGVCDRYPALRCLFMGGKPDHKTWSCACRIIEEKKKNSEVGGRPVVVENEY